jgi:urease accessory protein
MGSDGQSPSPPDAIEDGDRGWRARLELDFVAREGATRIARWAHEGPLVVQRPFFPEGPGVCHVYLLHPPGGLVGGDRLSIDVRVGPGAHALCTTPAATKLYRTAGPLARLEQSIAVEAGGALEWLPQETILYDGTHADLRTRIELPPGARFIGTDVLCFGLPARGEGFARGRCRQAIEIWRDGRPLFVERGRLDGARAVHAAGWGMGGAPVLGTLLASPAPGGALLEALRALGEALPEGDLGAATVLPGDVLALRYVGGSVERARRFLGEAWRLARPALLGRAAEAPRIWAT